MGCKQTSRKTLWVPRLVFVELHQPQFFGCLTGMTRRARRANNHLQTFETLFTFLIQMIMRIWQMCILWPRCVLISCLWEVSISHYTNGIISIKSCRHIVLQSTKSYVDIDYYCYIVHVMKSNFQVDGNMLCTSPYAPQAVPISKQTHAIYHCPDRN